MRVGGSVDGDARASSRTSLGPHAATPLISYVLVVILAGTTMPTPMYALYADRMNFGLLCTTVIFAIYASGVLAALLIFGRWSDAIGRRPMLLGAVVLALSSDAAFLVAGGIPLLLVGRVLSGLSAGIVTGTATAALVEAAPPGSRERASTLASVANIGGLAAGPVLAGILVQYAPLPLRLPFVVHVVLTVLAAAAVIVAPETSPCTGHFDAQRLSIPAQVRSVFVIASLASFAGFAATALFTSVMPTFLVNVAAVTSHAVSGLAVGAMFVASAVAQVAAHRIPARPSVITGCLTLLVAMAILVVALRFSSLPCLLAAALIAGAGQGISFSRGLAAVLERTPAARRGEVSSAFFVIVYVAISVPVVGEGLAARIIGVSASGMAFAIAVAALSTLCLVTILVQRPRRVES